MKIKLSFPCKKNSCLLKFVFCSSYIFPIKKNEYNIYSEDKEKMINSLDTWGIFVSAIQHVFKLFLFKKY